MSRYFYIFFLTIFLYGSPVFCQDFSYTIDKYSTLNGLPDNNIVSLQKDTANNLIIATRYSVVSYNDYRFETNEDLKFQNRIKHILVDRNNFLWIIFLHSKRDSLGSIIKCYSLNQKKFINLNSVYPKIVDKLSLNTIHSGICEYDGNCFLLFTDFTSYNLTEKKYDNVDQRLIDKSIALSRNITQSPIFKNLNISKIEGRNHIEFTKLSKEDTIKYIFGNSNEYNDLGKGFRSVKNNRDEVIIKVSSPIINVCDTKSSTYFYNQKNIIEVSAKNRIDITERYNEIFRSVEIFEMLAKDSKVWVATSNGLFSIYKKKNNFRFYLKNSNISVREFEIIGEDSILIASDKGTYLLNSKTNKLDTLVPIVNNYSITKIDSKKYYLKGFSNYLGIWSKEHKNKINSLIINNICDSIVTDQCITTIFDLYVDPFDKWWLASDNGIFRYDKEKNSLINTQHSWSNLSISKFQKLDDGTVIAFSNNGPIIIISGNKQQEKVDKLKGHYITMIYQARGPSKFHWVATKGSGMLKCDNNWNILDTINTKDGLQSNNVHSIIEDSKDQLWLSTDFGISVYHKQNNGIITLLREQGLLEVEMNRNSFLQLPDSTILYGTINGFLHFDPKDIDLSIDPKDIQFHHFEFIDHSGTKQIRLIDDEQEVIKFSEKLNKPKLILKKADHSFSTATKYFISGSQEKWKYTSNSEIDLSNLKKGSRELMISRQTDLNEWTSPKIITLKISKPFYLNPYTYGYALLFLGLLVTFYLDNRRRRAEIRSRQVKIEIKKKTKELNIKNNQLTKMLALNDQIFAIIGHDLRSPVTSLNDLSKTYNYLIENDRKEEIVELGHVIEDNTQKVLSIIDRLIKWANLKKQNIFLSETLKISSLLSYTLEDLKENIDAKNLTIEKINFNESIEIESDKESLLIILKNIIGNAIKFSYQGGQIKIKIEEGSEKKIHIIDSGTGMKQSKIHALLNDYNILSANGTEGEVGLGLGLRLSLDLANRLGAHLDIKNNASKGLTISLSFPS